MTEITLERAEEKVETGIKEIFEGSSIDTSIIQEELAFEQEINSIFNPIEPTSFHTEALVSKENVTAIPPIEEPTVSKEKLTLDENESANDNSNIDSDIVEPETNLETESEIETETDNLQENSQADSPASDHQNNQTASVNETETISESVHIPTQVVKGGKNTIKTKEKPIKEAKITLLYLAKKIFSKEIRYYGDLKSVMNGHWEFKKGKSVKGLYESIADARKVKPLDVPLIKEALKSHLVKVK
ncbi:hypothetical protein MZM54_03310 [[Brevibacterium] frigoritolerans]|nr:hypothetical protein [Peribacillus frigoritolerans]